jgi:clan AA aspartic protease (TIGR02281 family)
MFGNPYAAHYRNHVWLQRGLRYGATGPRRTGRLTPLIVAVLAAACLCAGIVRWSTGKGLGIAFAHGLAGRVEPDGQCYVTGLLNGASFDMLMDSGSTSILFGLQHLARIGVNPATLRFTHTVTVANGTAKAAEITLHEVRLGETVLHDVPALVVNARGDAQDNAPLLGTLVTKSMLLELGHGKCTLSP